MATSSDQTNKSFQVANQGGDKLWKLVQAIESCDSNNIDSLKEVSPSVDDIKKSSDYLLQKEKEVWDELVRLSLAKFFSQILHDSNFNIHTIMLLKASLASCDLRRPEKITATLNDFKEKYGYEKDLVMDIDELLQMKKIHDSLVMRTTAEKSGSRENLLKEERYTKGTSCGRAYVFTDFKTPN